MVRREFTKYWVIDRYVISGEIFGGEFALIKAIDEERGSSENST